MLRSKIDFQLSNILCNIFFLNCISNFALRLGRVAEDSKDHSNGYQQSHRWCQCWEDNYVTWQNCKKVALIKQRGHTTLPWSILVWTLLIVLHTKGIWKNLKGNTRYRRNDFNYKLPLYRSTLKADLESCESARRSNRKTRAVKIIAILYIRLEVNFFWVGGGL